MPLSWHKLRGGIETEWIGYWLDFGRFEIGISEKRRLWVIRWLDETFERGSVQIGLMRQALGRLSFVAGPLVRMRPLLGPIYAWASACPGFITLELPIMVRLLLFTYRQMIQERRVVVCRPVQEHRGELFRVDAKATEDFAVLGGWELCSPTRRGKPGWFSLRLDRASAPWIFVKESPQRVVASLELLAVLVSVVLFLDWLPRGRHSVGNISVVGTTDNQGNSYLLGRMLTTKAPLALVLIELACQLETRGIDMNIQWVPREENQEADDLTNARFDKFDVHARIPVDYDKLEWIILDKLLVEYKGYYEGLAARRAEYGTGVGQGRRRPGKLAGLLGLRATDPW